jgi:hypothetical protein
MRAQNIKPSHFALLYSGPGKGQHCRLTVSTPADGWTPTALKALFVENGQANSGMESPAAISRISRSVQSRPVVIPRDVRAFPEAWQEIVQ